MITGFPLLALLPILAFLALWILLAGRQPGPERSWRLSFVLASIAWGAYLAVTNEVLSLVRGLTALGVVVTWLIPVLVLAPRLWRSRLLALAWSDLRIGWAGLTKVEKLFTASLALVCGLLLGIALLSPPNNVDSALYHMARVMHWAQNASLRPYPTIMEHQLMKPIWAESAILHFRLLAGDDRPANLIQWFSMVGSVVIVSGIAGLLGARRSAQFLAAAFAVSIPMGVLQATSTQNDYVAAFWAVCLAYLVVLSVRRRLTGFELAALAASVGLAALTKGTAFVYAPPFVAWFLIHEATARGIRRALAAGLSIAALAVLLNAGFWARNVAVYGGPYGTSAWLQRNLWIRILEEPSTSSLELPAASGEQATPAGPIAAQDETLAPPLSTPTPAPGPSPSSRTSLGSYVVRLARTAGRNLTLPTGALSQPLTAALESLPGVFGKKYADEMRGVAWNSEDFAGNPLHLFFVPVSLVLLLLSLRKEESKHALGYAGITLLTFALIPIVIGHGPGIFGIRYQLSFFVLWAPVVGVSFGLAAGRRLISLLTAGFLLASVPWLLLNKSRPLIGMPPTRTVIGSLFTEDPVAVLLPWSPRLRDDYAAAADAVKSSGCRAVGLRADSSFLEYPLWRLLDAPQSGIRLEALETAEYLGRFADPDFAPCVVVCANCGDETELRGLPLFGTYDSIKVYRAR